MSGHSLRQSDLHRRPGGDDPGEVGEDAAAVGESVGKSTSEINPIVLAIWLAVQLGALALAASRVPLAAQYPQPAEFQAVRFLVTVQFLVSAMFCPVLMRGWRMTFIVVLTAEIFIFFAGGLAAWSVVEPCQPALYLALWLVTLAVWVKVVGAARSHLISAISATYAGGGPLLWYLGQDLGSGDRTLSQISYGPLLPLLISPHRPTFSGWVCLISLLVAGLALSVARRTQLF